MVKTAEMGAGEADWVATQAGPIAAFCSHIPPPTPPKALLVCIWVIPQAAICGFLPTPPSTAAARSMQRPCRSP